MSINSISNIRSFGSLTEKEMKALRERVQNHNHLGTGVEAKKNRELKQQQTSFNEEDTRTEREKRLDEFIDRTSNDLNKANASILQQYIRDAENYKNR